MYIVMYETFYKGPYNITDDKMIILNTYEKAKQVYKELKMDVCYFDIRLVGMR